MQLKYVFNGRNEGMDLIPAPQHKEALDPEAIGKLVRYWVYYDNKVAELNKEKRQLQATQDAYEQQILQQLKASNMANPVIQIGGGRIVIGDTKSQQPLSYTMLEATLTKYYGQKPGAKNETKDILAFIRAQRTVQTTQGLKRVTNPTSRSRSNSKGRPDTDGK
jgi:hypothetical protein